MHSPGSPPLLAMVKKLRLWKDFSRDEEAAILSLPYTMSTLEAGRYLVRDGDRPKSACLLVSGFACRHKIVANGARSISAVHMRGDIVDLQNSLLGLADHSVQTLTDCEIATISRAAILELAFSFPNVGMAMWYDTLVDASIFREWIANVARRDAASRVAHLLCEFAVRLEAAELGDKFSFELPMTQEQLADATGLTSVHINRTLKTLEASGDIGRAQRHVAIADWDKLRKTADFRTAYLHLPEEPPLAK
jgi:CRP-like cAMP-binding protein